MATEYSGDFAGDVAGLVTSQLVLNDDAKLAFGTGEDVSAYFDGTFLVGMAPGTSVLGAIGMWADCPAHGNMITDPGPAPTTFYDDFVTLNYNASLGTGIGATWQVTQASAGGGSGYAVALLSAVSGGVGGVVSVTTNDSVQADGGYKSGDYVTFRVPGASFYLSDDGANDLWFEARVAISDVTACAGVVGLVAADSSITVDPESGIYWRISAGSLDFITSKGGTVDSCGYKSCDTALGIAGTTLSAGEFHRLGFRVSNGGGRIIPYINGSPASNYQFTDSTNAWPVVPLTPAFEIQTSVDTVQALMYVDWVKCVQKPHARARHSA